MSIYNTDVHLQTMPTRGDAKMEYQWIDDQLSEGFSLVNVSGRSFECCCLQQNITWEVSRLSQPHNDDKNNDQYDSLYTVKEDAPKYGRSLSFCFPGNRETSYSVLSDEGIMLYHRKKRTNGANVWLGSCTAGQFRLPCCFDLPYLDTVDRSDQRIGSTRLLCRSKQPCIPTFSVNDELNAPLYIIEPDSCCFGQCVACPSWRMRVGANDDTFCTVLYHIRDFRTRQKLGSDIAIKEMWMGLTNECCFSRKKYSVKFPPSATASEKLTLMGSTILFDMIVNEQGGN